jgi:hypothetical protein
MTGLINSKKSPSGGDYIENKHFNGIESKIGDRCRMFKGKL